MQKRSFTNEFRAQVVAQWPNKTTKQLCEEYKITPGMLSNWRKKLDHRMMKEETSWKKRECKQCVIHEQKIEQLKKVLAVLVN